MRALVPQFRKPTGLLGSLVGRMMARMNRQLNEWTVSLLEVERADRVIEVGFGPGLAIERIAALAPDGLVVGVDCSEVMVRQAHKRNVATIRAGRVQLIHGDVLALPYKGESFDKALSVNGLAFWADRIGGLREIGRVLRPKGLIAITLQPRGVDTGGAQKIGREVMAQLAEAGFHSLRIEMREMKSAPALCLLGLKG